jgi:hypothetical protein
MPHLFQVSPAKFISSQHTHTHIVQDISTCFHLSLQWLTLALLLLLSSPQEQVSLLFLLPISRRENLLQLKGEATNSTMYAHCQSSNDLTDFYSPQHHHHATHFHHLEEAGERVHHAKERLRSAKKHLYHLILKEEEGEFVSVSLLPLGEFFFGSFLMKGPPFGCGRTPCSRS